MKRVILPVGIRGSGKSTYCKEVKSLHPEIRLVCRDEFFEKKFGRFTFDPYTGEGHNASECFWKHVKSIIRKLNGTLIVDCFTGWASERRMIGRELRQAGADEVSCWFFDTSLETTIQWFVKRELDPKKRWETESDLAFDCRHDYELFRENIQDILPGEDDEPEEAWFDSLRIINPEQLVLVGMPLL